MHVGCLRFGGCLPKLAHLILDLLFDEQSSSLAIPFFPVWQSPIIHAVLDQMVLMYLLVLDLCA